MHCLIAFDVMQLAGINHVQSLFARVLKSRNEISVEGIHASGISFVAREIQIKPFCASVDPAFRQIANSGI